MSNVPSSPQILECTLRDGSYAINYQFTASDTAILCSRLEDAGFGLIEIGHGVGLNASNAGHGAAAETDEDYLRAAADALKDARFGMFCIPGIARLEDVEMAAEHGMGFLRVGTDVMKAEQSEPFIAAGKKHGMLVAANFMKSYATDPKEFAKKARLSRQYGADILYVVDSAGGMLRADLDEYFRAVRDDVGIPIGFHGHDNLGLAVAHSLRAVEMGAVVVDSTLQGLGRSSGNAATERLVPALERMGVELGIDPIEVMDIGEQYIKPLIKCMGLDSIDVVSGYAQFHSSYMGLIRDYSSKYRIDPRKLIIGLCKRDKVNAPRELVEQIAREISADSSEVSTARYHWEKYFGHEQDN